VFTDAVLAGGAGACAGTGSGLGSQGNCATPSCESLCCQPYCFCQHHVRALCRWGLKMRMFTTGTRDVLCVEAVQSEAEDG